MLVKCFCFSTMHYLLLLQLLCTWRYVVGAADVATVSNVLVVVVFEIVLTWSLVLLVENKFVAATVSLIRIVVSRLLQAIS